MNTRPQASNGIFTVLSSAEAETLTTYFDQLFPADAFLPRSKPFPMRPFRLGEPFKQATERMGLHAHPVPAGVNTVPYRGRPATTHGAWSNGFDSTTGDKWDPSLTCIPEALATGNFDLRTHCRVIRIATDENGRANGAEYVDPLGRRQFQRARVVLDPYHRDRSGLRLPVLRITYDLRETRGSSILRSVAQTSKSFCIELTP